MASRQRPRQPRRPRQPETSSDEEDDDEEENESVDAPRRVLKTKGASGEVEDKLVLYHRNAGNQTYVARTKPLKFKIRVKTPSLHWQLCQKCGGIVIFYIR
jgi:hypothetical protein